MASVTACVSGAVSAAHASSHRHPGLRWQLAPTPGTGAHERPAPAGAAAGHLRTVTEGTLPTQQPGRGSLHGPSPQRPARPDSRRGWSD